MNLDHDSSIAPEMEVTSTVVSGGSKISNDTGHDIVSTVSAVTTNPSVVNMQTKSENHFKVRTFSFAFRRIVFKFDGFVIHFHFSIR